MPKEGRIISHIRLFMPKYRAEIPFKEVLEWAEKVYKKACAKSGKPIRLSDDEFWKDKADIARAFRQGLKRAYETVEGVPAKRILEKLPLKSAERAREMVFDQWSSVGPGGPAAILAGLWLSGDRSALKLLREKDQALIGEPVLITGAERAGQLRKQLRTLLVKLTGIISDANFLDEEVKDAEGRINKLVRGFIKDEPAGMSPDVHRGAGRFEVSVKFVLVPESVTPADSKEVMEIKYKINEFFLGGKIANHLRRTSIEKDYITRPDPDEYIGHPDQPAGSPALMRGKSAYFDMFLDIRVLQR